jgi:hypothetical protein
VFVVGPVLPGVVACYIRTGDDLFTLRHECGRLVNFDDLFFHSVTTSTHGTNFRVRTCIIAASLAPMSPSTGSILAKGAVTVGELCHPFFLGISARSTSNLSAKRRDSFIAFWWENAFTRKGT